jgi:hypothetical protein
MERGDFVTLSRDDASIVAMVALASGNKKSLMLMFEGAFCGHYGSMPVLIGRRRRLSLDRGSRRCHDHGRGGVMRLSVTEAAKRWCPFTRMSRHGTTVNRAFSDVTREPVIPREAACISSDCMAWRWSRNGGAIGYCGLAGVPDGEQNE